MAESTIIKNVLIFVLNTWCNIKGICIHTKGYASDHCTEKLLLWDQPHNRKKENHVFHTLLVTLLAEMYGTADFFYYKLDSNGLSFEVSWETN